MLPYTFYKKVYGNELFLKMQNLKYLHYYFLLGLSLLSLSCQNQAQEMDAAAPDTLEVDVPNALDIDLKAIVEQAGPGALQEVEIAIDPVYKTPKRFLALPFQPIIDSKLASLNWPDSAAIELLLICKDGYTPYIPITKLEEKQAWLAVKDLEAPEGQNWPDSLAKKLEPYYLVWEDVPAADRSFAWPYALTHVQLVSYDVTFKDIYPFDDESQRAGFLLFKETCLKCHSINRIGGIMGPELNFPKNITEYWKKEDIIAFVKDPFSYRYNSKMAPITQLSDGELATIISYLEYMKEHKIKE